MIKERKYSEQNPANAKYHKPLINIKNAIKKYIQSQPEIYKYYNFSYKSQVHDQDLILDECIKRVKYGSTYRSSIYLPKSTFNKIYLDLITEINNYVNINYQFKSKNILIKSCLSTKKKNSLLI